MCTCSPQWRALNWTTNGPTPHDKGCPDGPYHGTDYQGLLAAARSPRGFYASLAKDESSAGFPRLERLQRSFSMLGKWRVYFNRHGAEPLMWCISPEDGSWEIAVRDVQLATIAESVYRKKPVADEDDGRPSAWFSIEGQLTINPAGFATIGAP